MLNDFERRALTAILQVDAPDEAYRLDSLSVTKREASGVGFFLDLADPSKPVPGDNRRFGLDVYGFDDEGGAVLRFMVDFVDGRLTDMEMWNDAGDWPNDLSNVRFEHDPPVTGPRARTAAE